MTTTFKETWEVAKEKYNKPKLYNRCEAYKLLGFKNSKAFTDWLRDNEFMSYHDDPDSYLTERGLMEVVVKYRTTSLPVDDYGIRIGGTEYSSIKKTETDYVPLFTEKGISYFKNLLADPEELNKVSDEIKSQNKHYSIPVC